ncbi:multiubiquitin domain-containing protein [Pseudomonas citronellolis]|uniref:multiubiquitin domain-containing protein n=1 Tax=Pseudomonas citronellolis TaxID=53408 RepID=UPI0021BE7C25|nr:multiubiquitin domain-containing protein [Pseudomonas citronellolis]UXJ50305.1 multiubiquitin domain-containing protein [Pseudomonas citronellolis]
MQHENPNPGQLVVEVADQTLIYRQVNVHDSTPTGAQIAAAAGFKPDQMPVILQVQETGSLEDIRPDEVVNLCEGVNRFIVVESDRTYRFAVDGAIREWPCRHITGHVIRRLGEVTENMKLLLEREDEADLEITDQQLVDLDEPGIERFVSRKAAWKLKVQGKIYEFDTPCVVIRDAVVRANLNPDTPWHIYFLVEGRDKQEMSINDVIDLRTPGIEKLRLTQRDVGNGEAPPAPRRDFALLPVDEVHLNESGYCWETFVEGQSRWLVIHDYPLPEGYSPRCVNLALLITAGYPQAMLDMFYLYPAVTLTSGKTIPATEGTATIEGIIYQRWSRHRSWSPSVDNVVSQLAMADGCLHKEVEQ